ncbi:MAG: efflux RND transporter periplasmic adaptor subunit [Planctomycetota bacterium]|jgi:RND family efflux transporter MFP subunit
MSKENRNAGQRIHRRIGSLQPGFLAILILLGTAAFLMPACFQTGGSAVGASPELGQEDPEGKQDEPTFVHVVGTRLTKSPIHTFIEISSDIESLNTVAMYPHLSGIQVTGIFADEGDYIRKGDLMAQLDASEIELEHAQAEVNYEEAKHRRDKAQFALEEVAERVTKARFEAEKVKADLDQAEKMFANELISEDQIEQDRLAWENASSELEIVQLQNNQGSLDLQLAEIEMKKSKLAMDDTAIKLSRTRITAPFGGHVSFRSATLGMSVSTSTHLFTLVDRSELVANLYIPQEDLRKVETGMEVRFTCDALPEREFKGSVTIINPVVDPNTGTVKLRAKLDPDDEEKLRPGMFINARIIIDARDDALLIPRKAVFYDDEKPTFFLIEEEDRVRMIHFLYFFLIEEGDRVRMIHFLPGGSTETALEIASTELKDSPVDEGALIVIVGQDNLKDGEQVKVVKEIS